jgi:O-antigen/teichoic acid export membrane protein
MKRAVFSNFSVSIMIAVFGLIGSVLIARELGPASRGDVAAAILWPNLLLYLGSIGTYQSFVFFYSKNRNHRLMWGNCISAAILNSVVSVLFGFLFIQFALHGFSDHVKYYSILLLLSLPFSIMSQIIISILQAKQKFKQVNILRSIFPSLYLFSALFLYFTKTISFENIIRVQTSLNIVLALISIYYYNRLIGDIRSYSISRRSVGCIYKYGAKVWVGDLSQGINTRFDQILISNLFTSSQLGYYVVAQSVANFTTLLANSFRTVLLPIISGSVGNEKFRDILRTNLIRFNWINGVMIFCSLFAGPILIRIAYGEKFMMSVTYVIILLIGFAFLNMKTIYATILQGMGFPLQSSISEIAGFVFIGIFAYPISIWFGITGMVVVIAVSYLIQFLVIQFYFKSKLNSFS